jgi:hypothetical protein
MSRIRRALRLVAVPLLAAASLATLSTVTPLTATAGATARATTSTVWLCKPGTTPDPCAGNLSYSVVPAGGATKVVTVHAAKAPSIDCFYVYPTVSGEDTPNSDLAIQAAEIGTAEEQVAPLSQDCKVFAPMYRQMTVPCLEGLQGSGAVCSAKNVGAVLGTLDVAYQSMVQGFDAFLAQIPKGEHFVLMGHSQGAAMLIRLIMSVVDPDPALRSRLVSAILLGGNLTVPKGKLVGGAFKHIPLCNSAGEVGCAIAYSSFYDQPPTDSNFGIPGTGVSFMWLDNTKSASLQVACVAPNRLLGQHWTDQRFASSSGPAPYVAYPDLYQAQCQYSDGVSFLHVTVPAAGHGNTRPTVKASLGPSWGLHLSDPNLTLGDLVSVVAREAATAAK